MVRVKGFDYQLSDKKGKKLMVTVKGKKIHFGDVNYEQYKDKTGLLPSSSNHGDKKRRDSYLKRARGIGNSSDVTSANYHAINILWDSP
jgi:hypothetical protein